MNILSKTTFLVIVVSACLTGQVKAGKPIIDNSVTVVKHVGEIPTIEVDGRNGRYDTVVTKHLDFYLVLQGRRPDRGKSATGVLYVEGVKQDVPDVLSHERYLVRTPVMDLRAWRAVNQRVSPIKLCNDELSYQKGNARKKFLKKGGTIWRHSAYEVKGASNWLIKGKKRLIRQFNPDTRRTFDSKPFLQGVNVKCRGVNRNRGSKTTSAKPLPREVIEKEMAKKFKKRPISLEVSAEPKKFRRAGKFLCPARLKLSGRAKGNRTFVGKLFYKADGWKSKTTRVNLKKGTKIDVDASYPLQWSLGGNKPKSKKIDVEMKVMNNKNKLIQTIANTVEVKCKRSENES